MRPTRLIIGHTPWRVLWDQKQKVEGLCDFESRTLSFKKGLSKDDRRTAFLHEVLHAFTEMYLPNAHHYLEGMKPKHIDEAYVKAMEMGLMLFVRDNPDAWRWTMERNK